MLLLQLQMICGHLWCASHPIAIWLLCYLGLFVCSSSALCPLEFDHPIWLNHFWTSALDFPFGSCLGCAHQSLQILNLIYAVLLLPFATWATSFKLVHLKHLNLPVIIIILAARALLSLRNMPLRRSSSIVALSLKPLGACQHPTLPCFMRHFRHLRTSHALYQTNLAGIWELACQFLPAAIILLGWSSLFPSVPEFKVWPMDSPLKLKACYVACAWHKWHAMNAESACLLDPSS